MMARTKIEDTDEGMQLSKPGQLAKIYHAQVNVPLLCLSGAEQYSYHQTNLLEFTWKTLPSDSIKTRRIVPHRPLSVVCGRRSDMKNMANLLRART
jgi:hypothetical protein